MSAADYLVRCAQKYRGLIESPLLFAGLFFSIFPLNASAENSLPPYSIHVVCYENSWQDTERVKISLSDANPGVIEVPIGVKTPVEILIKSENLSGKKIASLSASCGCLFDSELPANHDRQADVNVGSDGKSSSEYDIKFSGWIVAPPMPGATITHEIYVTVEGGVTWTYQFRVAPRSLSSKSMTEVVLLNLRKSSLTLQEILSANGAVAPVTKAPILSNVRATKLDGEFATHTIDFSYESTFVYSGWFLSPVFYSEKNDNKYLLGKGIVAVRGLGKGDVNPSLSVISSSSISSRSSCDILSSHTVAWGANNGALNKISLVQTEHELDKELGRIFGKNNVASTVDFIKPREMNNTTVIDIVNTPLLLAFSRKYTLLNVIIFSRTSRVPACLSINVN